MASRVRIDRVKAEAAISAMCQAAALRGANRYRERVREEILQSGRVRTGEMYTDITIRPMSPRPGVARAQVSPQADHFVFQNFGTNGVENRPGRVLRFKPKGSSVFVFARSTRGVTAGDFLEKARLKMRAEDFT